MMKVLLLSRYSHLGASSRVRFYLYVSYLVSQGFEITVAPLLRNDYLEDLHAGRRTHLTTIFDGYLGRLRSLLYKRAFDVLWVEGELLPWLPAWGEALLARQGRPYVVDYDDAIFHRYDQHPNAMIRFCLGRKIDTVMQNAALVVVGNEYLADHARKAGAKRVAYLPSVIDLERYSPGLYRQSRMCTIGWIGSPVTAKYLRLVHAALTEVCRQGKARVVAVGAGRLSLEGIPFEVRAWSEEREVADIRDFDVGIMPLQDGPFERGKCGYKLIQYMACGLPVVASPVGVNRHLIADGVNGFLSTTQTEWATSLLALCENADLRAQMGAAGRRQVEAQYCLQVTAPQLCSLLYDVAGAYPASMAGG